MVTLIPPDPKRCQAEKPNLNYSPFSLGGNMRRLIRCDNAPTVYITEREPDKDGVRGKMSLCDECLEVAKKQLGEHRFAVTVRRKGSPKTQGDEG